MVQVEILIYTQIMEDLQSMRVQIHSVVQVNNSSVHCVSISLLKVDLLVHLLHSVTVLRSGYYSPKIKVGNGPCFSKWYIKTQGTATMNTLLSNPQNLMRLMYDQEIRQYQVN